MTKKNAISLISRIRDEANKLIMSELEKHDVTEIVPSHGGIFLALYRFERLTMKELSEAIHRTKPTVTVLVNKLVSLGFVQKQKDVNDNRVTYISLTKKGKALEGVFQEVSSTLNEVVYGGLSSEEQIQLETILNKVLGRF